MRDLARTRMIIGGAFFGLCTLTIILPGILTNAIRDNLHTSAAVAGVFGYTATAGNVAGLITAAVFGQRLNRKKYAIVSALLGAALFALLPFVHVTSIRIVIVFFAAWGLAIEPFVRSLLEARVRFLALQGALTAIFLGSLFFDRIPFLWITPDPWKAMALAGALVAAMALLNLLILPSDSNRNDAGEGGAKETLKELWRELRSPTTAWALLLGGIISGAAYIAVDVTSSLSLKDHGWVGPLWLTVYGATQLVGGVSAWFYRGFAKRQPQRALMIASIVTVLGYAALLPCIWLGGTHSVAWLAVFLTGASIVLIGVNLMVVATLSAETTTKVSLWLVMRVTGITGGIFIVTQVYSAFKLPGMIGVGAGFSLMGVALAPIAIRHLSRTGQWWKL